MYFILHGVFLSTPVQMQLLLKDWGYDFIIQMCTVFIYTPWNLDLFGGLKFVYIPLCISPTATQAYVIEGAFGLYPLLLIVVFYSFITLRDRGCKVIVKIWKPFHFIISRFQQNIFCGHICYFSASIIHENWICCCIYTYPITSLETRWQLLPCCVF